MQEKPKNQHETMVGNKKVVLSFDYIKDCCEFVHETKEPRGLVFLTALKRLAVQESLGSAPQSPYIDYLNGTEPAASDVYGVREMERKILREMYAQLLQDSGAFGQMQALLKEHKLVEKLNEATADEQEQIETLVGETMGVLGDAARYDEQPDPEATPETQQAQMVGEATKRIEQVRKKIEHLPTDHVVRLTISLFPNLIRLGKDALEEKQRDLYHQLVNFYRTLLEGDVLGLKAAMHKELVAKPADNA